MVDGQSVKAVAKYIRMSPQKVRRVLNQLRGRSYQEALMILEFLSYSACVGDVLKQFSYPGFPQMLKSTFVEKIL